MAIDISEYLDIIAGESDGEEVILAIHDASLALGTDMYKTADIEDLLNDILNKDRGVDIRMAIHEVLKRLSEAGYDPEPSSGGTVFTNHSVMIAKTYGYFQEPIATPYGIATKEE
jgi:2C-methyl-D-erythritol 2,4-cyclodiphosphate synthase